VISTLQTGVILFVLSRFVFSPELSLALGGSQMAIHLNLIAFGLLFSPISTLLGVVLNQFSRKNEFEADAYAAQTFAAAPLREALIKLHQKNLSNLTPHPWYVFFNYSHPPLLQRLRALTPTEA
jgi:STE24 endopeptidase